MRQWGEKNLHLSAEQIGERGPATTIGHVNHVDPGHHLEQLAGNMGPGADASRCHADLARTGFSVGDEFGNGLGRYRRIHHDHTGKADEARDRRDVTDEMEIEFVVERRVDRLCRTDHEQRVAVSGRATTASVAMLVPAPGRLSTTTGWPSRSDSHCPMRRA